ncbi:DUF2637 domain-containing protein [Kitasatospora sp. NPDC017646]|uniref:DUF2637 domain-containing protein n=1 Tax=Kitasatospora sp. NPDC017646 TaxID=3364024 RepID=UPI00379A13EA
MYESTDTTFAPRYASGFAPDDGVILNHPLWPPVGQSSPEAPYPVVDGWADASLQSHAVGVEALMQEVGLPAPGFHPRVIADHPQHRSRTTYPARRGADIVGSVIGFLTAAIVTVVCILGWAISYHPLQDVALSRLPRGLSQYWPVVVYGPWMAASLSVLRAALGGRKVANSWTVILVFAGIASGLCIVDTPSTMPEAVVAGLPPVTAVVSLQQMVRQLLVARQVSEDDVRQKPSHRASR